MLESVFILMILMTLLFSIEFTGRLRSHALELLGQSSYQSFLQTREKVIPVDFLSEKSSGHGGLLQTFEQELLQVHHKGLIKTSARQISTPYVRSSAYRLFGFQPMQRSSFLYVQAGESRSAIETQARIEQSNAAWRQTTLPTQKLLHPHIAQFKKIDTPWGRAALQTDWLNHWAGLVPVKSRRGDK